MHDNRSLLRGKQTEWQKQVAEEEFANDPHITQQKVTNKINNMKKAWKAAKAMQEQSGWGLREEDVESSISERLDQRCPFFWQLDDLWRDKPNMISSHTVDSIASSQANTPGPLPSTPAFPPTPSQSNELSPESMPAIIAPATTRTP
jgi:hypothetical protein